MISVAFFRSSWGCIWARDTRSGEGVGRASGLARIVGHRSVPSSLLRVICCKRVWCCFRNPGGRVLPAFGRAGCVLSLCLCFCKINCACFSLCWIVIFITLCGYGLSGWRHVPSSFSSPNQWSRWIAARKYVLLQHLRPPSAIHGKIGRVYVVQLLPACVPCTDYEGQARQVRNIAVLRVPFTRSACVLDLLHRTIGISAVVTH